MSVAISLLTCRCSLSAAGAGEELALLRVQPALCELRAAAAASQHARRQAELRHQVRARLIAHPATSESVPPPHCCLPLSDPEAAAEEEAGGDLGPGEDLDAPLNSCAWIHL